MPNHSVPSTRTSGPRRAAADQHPPFSSFGRVQPHRNVTAAVQYAPNVDVVPLDIEHQMRITLDLPATQARQVEFGCVASRANGRVTLDVAKCLFQRVDEFQRCTRRALTKIEIDRLFDVAIGSRPQNGALVAHRLGWRRTRLRNLLKYARSAGPAEADAAPSSNSSRKWVRSWSLRMRSRTYSLLVP